MGFFGFLLLGLIAGAIAKLILPGKQGGGWLITSELREDFQPQLAYYTAEGELVRSERTSEADPLVAKPIELDELLRLWQRKRLPTGSTR